jgi:hypothetical protein
MIRKDVSEGQKVKVQKIKNKMMRKDVSGGQS